MSVFVRAVMRAFHRLLAGGELAILEARHDDAAPAHALVVMAGRHVRLRLASRGKRVAAEVASKRFPEEWVPLERALRAVGAPARADEGPTTPEEAAVLVAHYLSAFEIEYSPRRLGATRARLAELARKRANMAPPTGAATGEGPHS